MLYIYYLMQYIMNNVNALNKINTSHQKSNRFSKFPYVVALCTMLNIANPTEMKADSIANNNIPGIEVVSDSNIIANIERRTRITIPKPYDQKLKNFISTNKIMQDEWSAKYTADFIVKQMQANRWISKQSQLLFIWTHIYNEITGTYLYDWSDGDENRLNEYGNVMDRAEKCWKDFKNWYIVYIKQRSADAQQRSADAQQRSANAQQRSTNAIKKFMKLDSIRIGNNLKEFYETYTRNPNIVKQEEIKFMKKRTKEVISECKRYWIDYKDILLKEVWDKKKVDTILKFYDVE